MENKGDKLVFSVFVFVMILFLLLVGLAIVSYNRNRVRSEEPFAKQVSEDIVVHGILVTSGLTTEEKEAFELENNANFQITYLNDSQFDEDGLFVVTNEDLERYLGKCVSITGDIKPLVSKINPEQYNYGRNLIVPVSINLLERDDCSIGLKQVGSTHKTSGDGIEMIKVRGQVIRNNRPAPDIAYDYAIVLDEPIEGNTSNLNQLELVSISPQILEDLEDNLGKKFVLSGNIETGYSESKVFVVNFIQLIM